MAITKNKNKNKNKNKKLKFRVKKLKNNKIFKDFNLNEINLFLQ